MESVILVEDKVVVRLNRADPGLLVLIENPEDGATVAEFRVTAPLLKAVLSGFSYQIANGWGSLQMTSADGTVKIEFQDQNKKKVICRTKSDFFMDAITKLAVN